MAQKSKEIVKVDISFNEEVIHISHFMRATGVYRKFGIKRTYNNGIIKHFSRSIKVFPN